MSEALFVDEEMEALRHSQGHVASRYEGLSEPCPPFLLAHFAARLKEGWKCGAEDRIPVLCGAWTEGPGSASSRAEGRAALTGLSSAPRLTGDGVGALNICKSLASAHPLCLPDWVGPIGWQLGLRAGACGDLEPASFPLVASSRCPRAASAAQGSLAGGTHPALSEAPSGLAHSG